VSGKLQVARQVAQTAKGLAVVAQASVMEALFGTLTDRDRRVLVELGRQGQAVTPDIFVTGIDRHMLRYALNNLEAMGLVRNVGEVDTGKGGMNPLMWQLEFPWVHLQPVKGSDEAFVRAFRLGPRILGQWWEDRWYEYKNGDTPAPPPWPHEVFPQLLTLDYGFYEGAFPHNAAVKEMFMRERKK